jgi:general secretion pathway protein I
MADAIEPRSAGFTLLEVIVALLIFAVASGVLFEAFGSALDRTGRLERQKQALILLRSQLAAVGIDAPLAVGETAGGVDDVFDWRIRIGPPRMPTQKSGHVALYPIQVTVSWVEGSSPQSITLESSRLAAMDAGSGS